MAESKREDLMSVPRSERSATTIEVLTGGEVFGTDFDVGWAARAFVRYFDL
jgi:hypothetical protein